MSRKKPSFSDQIRQAIRDSELTRYRIAKETGVSESALSRFVNGERSLNLSTIDLLADLLGLEVSVKKKGQK